MHEIWFIRLSETTEGKFVIHIQGEGGRSSATADTATEAYKLAEAKLIVKPGFVRSTQS